MSVENFTISWEERAQGLITGTINDNSSNNSNNNNNTNNNNNSNNNNNNSSSSSNNQSDKRIRELFFNGTGYYIEDEIDNGLNDLQTLILACLATLIPLVVALLIAFGIRVLWTTYKRRRENRKYDGMVESKLKLELSQSFNSGTKKISDTHLDIINNCDGIDDVELCDSSTISQIRSNHSSTNGSIITMTLKNNHLIVETEERNDLQEDSRETTMRYSPGARNGIFVVEVQQGSRRSPGSSKNQEMLSSDQCALIHSPPERFNNDNNDDRIIEECNNDYYIETVPPPISQILTGLSQSNTSLSTTNQQTYTYTNQKSYQDDDLSSDYYYYHHHQDPNSLSSDYDNWTKKRRLVPNSTKPKITAAVYKNQSKLISVDDEHEIIGKLLLKSSSSNDYDNNNNNNNNNNNDQQQ